MAKSAMMAMEAKERVEEVEQVTEYFQFLDDLRESGATNMFGAASYLMDSFDLDRHQARGILKDWVDSFDPSKTPVK